MPTVGSSDDKSHVIDRLLNRVSNIVWSSPPVQTSSEASNNVIGFIVAKEKAGIEINNSPMQAIRTKYVRNIFYVMS